MTDTPTLEDYKKEFGERLQTLVREAGIPDGRAAANKIGVKYASFNKWINGEHMPKTPELVLISKAFGETIDYLLTGVHSNPHEKTNPTDYVKLQEGIKMYKEFWEDALRQNRILKESFDELQRRYNELKADTAPMGKENFR